MRRTASLELPVAAPLTLGVLEGFLRDSGAPADAEVTVKVTTDYSPVSDRPSGASAKEIVLGWEG